MTERRPIPLAVIERTIIGWFEACGYEPEYQNGEWIVWPQNSAVHLTEIAVAIKVELERVDGEQAPKQEG